jgi:hypothetical protein
MPNVKKITTDRMTRKNPLVFQAISLGDSREPNSRTD